MTIKKRNIARECQCPAAPIRGISIVIPAANAANTISAQLSAIADQSFQGRVQVVVVDNSADNGRTASVVSRMSAQFDNIIIVNGEPGRGGNYARNLGIREASEEYIALCDADDVVAADWLASLVDGLASSCSVGGRLDYGRLNSPTSRRWRGERPWDEEWPCHLASCRRHVRLTVHSLEVFGLIWVGLMNALMGVRMR